jgi:hypothetical protein
MKLLKTILLLTCAVAAASSNAGLYEFETNPHIGGNIGDAVDEIRSTFDSSEQTFTWDVDLAHSSNPVDGFWLVVNNGPNPKSSDVNELAIIYGDLTTGVASTYVYNGENSASSINDPAILLQTDTFDTSASSFSLDISTSAINAWASSTSAYTGIAYDTAIGVWFHLSKGSDFTYNSDGDIVDFSFAQQGWLDFSNGTANDITPATEVNSPSALVMLGLSLFGLGLYRRKS